MSSRSSSPPSVAVLIPADVAVLIPAQASAADAELAIAAARRAFDDGEWPGTTVETFTTESEAIAIGNDTAYGLAGAVWTQDAGKAQRVAARLRHGTIWINDYHPYLPQAEWGGFGGSGNGRELGLAGLEEYRETKHIWQNTRPAPSGWFRTSLG